MALELPEKLIDKALSILNLEDQLQGVEHGVSPELSRLRMTSPSKLSPIKQICVAIASAMHEDPASMQYVMTQSGIYDASGKPTGFQMRTIPVAEGKVELARLRKEFEAEVATHFNTQGEHSTKAKAEEILDTMAQELAKGNGHGMARRSKGFERN